MTTPMSEERLAEIRAALDSVPAGPWWWRVDCGSPDLMTQHSGWLYLLGSEAVVREDGEPQTDIIVRTEYPDAEPPRAPLMRSSRELGAAFKTNPVVRFTEQSPTLVADLLAEVERLRVLLAPKSGRPATSGVDKLVKILKRNTDRTCWLIRHGKTCALLVATSDGGLQFAREMRWSTVEVAVESGRVVVGERADEPNLPPYRSTSPRWPADTYTYGRTISLAPTPNEVAS